MITVKAVGSDFEINYHSQTFKCSKDDLLNIRSQIDSLVGAKTNAA